MVALDPRHACRSPQRSPAFYDRFGDEIVAELVEWLNQVDAQYRSDVQQLNESNARRIDAQFAQLRAEMRLETQSATAELRNEMQSGKAELRTEMHAAMAELRNDMNAGFAALGVQIADSRADLIKWSFVFWVGAVFAVAALAGVLRSTN